MRDEKALKYSYAAEIVQLTRRYISDELDFDNYIILLFKKIDRFNKLIGGSQ